MYVYKINYTDISTELDKIYPNIVFRISFFVTLSKVVPFFLLHFHFTQARERA